MMPSLCPRHLRELAEIYRVGIASPSRSKNAAALVQSAVSCKECQRTSFPPEVETLLVATQQGELVYLQNPTRRMESNPATVARRSAEIVDTIHRLLEVKPSSLMFGRKVVLVAEDSAFILLASLRGRETKRARRWLDGLVEQMDATLERSSR